MCNIETEFFLNDIPCVRLKNDKYTCLITPEYGCSVVRLHDDENGIEVFRDCENLTCNDLKNETELHGLPTLYLPNRFYKGVIKTSDSIYRLPINEPLFGNYIHGWVHKRAHKIVNAYCDNEKAVLTTVFEHTDSDEMYRYFPINFSISYTFTLDSGGLLQEIALTNKSANVLPVSIGTHTCLNSHFTENGNEENLKLFVSIGEKCELDETLNPTEKLLPLNSWDKEYITGKQPTGQVLDNDMYSARMNRLNGVDFYGIYVSDSMSGHFVCNEVSDEFKFWNMWNNGGNAGFFCPEPMTAMINSPNLSLDRNISGYTELSEDETYTCHQRFFTL